jgi:hypothetical protein
MRIGFEEAGGESLGLAVRGGSSFLSPNSFPPPFLRLPFTVKNLCLDSLAKLGLSLARKLYRFYIVATKVFAPRCRFNEAGMIFGA